MRPERIEALKDMKNAYTADNAKCQELTIVSAQFRGLSRYETRTNNPMWMEILRDAWLDQINLPRVCNA